MESIIKNRQYYKFCFYGFLKNLRFFDAFLILFLIEKGLSFTQIGILYATREIVINLVEIPSGIIADTFGRKNSLATSLIIYISSFIIFYLFGSFAWFMLAFILYGVADAFRTGTHKGIIIDYLKYQGREESKIDYYGHTRSWSQKGSAISALIAGLIVFYSGNYQNIFLYSVIPYLANFILILSYPNNLNKSSREQSSKNLSQIWINVKSLFKIIKQPNVFSIINSSALHTAYLQAVKDYIQPLMVSVALIIPVLLNIEPERKNGIIIGVIYFVIYLATSYASKISGKVAARSNFNISYITLLFGFLFGIATGTFFILGIWTVSLIAFIGIYLIENLRKPILTGLVSDSVPNEILTSVISAQSQLKTILTATIAFGFGFLADKFGIGISFVTVSALLIIISAGIYFYNLDPETSR